MGIGFQKEEPQSMWQNVEQWRQEHQAQDQAQAQAQARPKPQPKPKPKPQPHTKHKHKPNSRFALAASGEPAYPSVS